jgi:two-component system sensor histidine kinase CpxA
MVVSNSPSGNGFFFDARPWVLVAGVVLLISVLFWIPMVRNITRPLSRMTKATEEIASGRFDVMLDEPRRDEIGRLARAINHMTMRLAAFVKGQKRFLGDISHELGSPLARIQFGLGVLDQRLDGHNRQRLQNVMDDVGHLSRLVAELLAFSRADLKVKSVVLEPVDLLWVVQEAVRREKAPDSEVIIDVDPDIRVLASPDLLTRALANLVRNGVKYAGQAGPIHIVARKDKGWVNLEVKDSGPGVPEEYLDQLFEPFFRPEPSRNRSLGGVGLGLSIVKTCVESCKGRVFARNQKPHGFVVTIILGRC